MTVHSLLERSPPESFASSRLSDPAVGPASLRFSDPSTASLELAPCEPDRHVRLGSVLRFSQPLNGLLASSSFTALFRAVATLDFSFAPSERSPREDRAPLSRPLAPLRSFTCVPRRTRRVLVTARFTDARAHARLPGSPPDYGRPFDAAEATCPGRPGSRRMESTCSAGFTRFEAFLPSRDRSRRNELPRTAGRCSPGVSSPLKPSPPMPGSLEPTAALSG